MYEDTGYVINDLYGSSSREVDKIRAYAVGMVRAFFNVSKEDALTHFEIVIVPFVDIYNDNGRILARRI